MHLLLAIFSGVHLRFLASLLVVFCVAGMAVAVGVDPAEIPGVVVDDADAEATGFWKPSAHVSPYVGDGYRHDDNAEQGEKSIRFVAQLPAPGEYLVLLAYTPGRNRASNVPVMIHAVDGDHEVIVNQKQPPTARFGFHPLGTFQFSGSDQPAIVVISNEGADNYVVADAVQFLPVEQAHLAELEEGDAGAGPPEVAVTRRPLEPAPEPVQITSHQLDELLQGEQGEIGDEQIIGDAQFLRRATLDLIGRQPTPQELSEFLTDTASDKRAHAIDRLLDMPEFGVNWANYWSDVISYRVPTPELTYLNYDPLKTWLGERFNGDIPWNETAQALISASGKVADNPPATFVGYHQANVERLAGETTRIFLATQIQCAECHDHPFVDMPRETFHQMAAFFVRSKAEIPHNNSHQIVVSDGGEREYRMPDMHDPGKQGEIMPPSAFGGVEMVLGGSDEQRRRVLAEWVTAVDNPYFGRAYVNHIWARLMSRGFTDPVDEIGEAASLEMPEVFDAVAGHLAGSDFATKKLFRLIMNTRAYQADVRPSEAVDAAGAHRVTYLRGDEVFDLLATSIKLPDFTPQQVAATGDIRFPPPPESTRDLVDNVFGYDPALPGYLVTRTMPQAMFLMNNRQLDAAIDASPESGTWLAELLAEESDDVKVLEKIYLSTLAREPTEREREIAARHIEQVGQRGTAFEDLLWAVINSAEFSTRR